jgi:hypothetical protein
VGENAGFAVCFDSVQQGCANCDYSIEQPLSAMVAFGSEYSNSAAHRSAFENAQWAMLTQL